MSPTTRLPERDMKRKKRAEERRTFAQKMAPNFFLLCFVAAAAMAADADPLLSGPPPSEVDLGDRPMMFVDYLNGPLRGRKRDDERFD